MKLQEYKELLLNQDLNQLDEELTKYNIIDEFMKNNKEISHKKEEGKSVANTITIEGLGDFSYFVYTPLKAMKEWYRESFTVRTGRQDFRALSFREALRYYFLPLLKSYDENLTHWGTSWDKEKYVEKINKKWDKYFVDLEKSLDFICGSPLDEIFLNNYSEKFNQSRATVFGGPKGKAIIWTTISGGYNIQQQHIRMFCKPLTETHIKEFGVSFR